MTACAISTVDDLTREIAVDGACVRRDRTPAPPAGQVASRDRGRLAITVDQVPDAHVRRARSLRGDAADHTHRQAITAASLAAVRSPGRGARWLPWATR